MKRRDFIKVASIPFVSGCVSTNNDTNRNVSDDWEPEHESAVNIDKQPSIGGGNNHIIAFEDPGCPFCRRFHETSLPNLMDYIEKNQLEFHYRGLSSVTRWSSPASVFLEAVYLREPDSFWDCLNYFYENQGSINQNNVFDEAMNNMEQNTDLDNLESLINDDEARNLARSDSGLFSSLGLTSTPVFFIFKDNSFLVSLNGNRSADVFERILELD
jgi:thioredoxin-related protein